jgi:hypothetical protein
VVAAAAAVAAGVTVVRVAAVADPTGAATVAAG